MSDGLRIAVAGATGLIGQDVVAAASACPDVALLTLSRRSPGISLSGNVQSVVGDPSETWAEGLAAFRPKVLICALGTTWRKAGREEAAFRAVDYDLVLATARAALEAGAERMVTISSVGADDAARSFYLRVKGETERDLRTLGWGRLDILRPGLLRGDRSGESRAAERAAIMLSPLTDRLLHGSARKYRSVTAADVARAALTLASQERPGVFVHHHDAIRRAAQGWLSRCEGQG